MPIHSLARLWARIDRRPAWTDAAIAILFAALASLWLWLQWPPERLPAAPWVAGLGLLQCLPLAWRRRFPEVVLLLVSIGTVLYGLAGGAQTPWTANAWLLAAYSAGAYGSDAWRTPARALGTAIYGGYVTYEILYAFPQADPIPETQRLILYQLFALFGNLAFVVWVWWFGDSTRLRRRREAELAERTAQLLREREVSARRAVQDERLRIARELHDVVAHHVSLMGVQAGAARHVLSRQPEQAAEALLTIEATGRQAVRELHHLLGMWRREDDDLLAPQPTLRQLAALLEQIRQAGLPVHLTISGKVRSLPPGVDLSAYRIVQEALTNTLKHAGAATASVSVHYGAAALDITVADDGHGAGADWRAGNGVIGMRERAAMLGGTVEIGPQPGGFAVHARLPLHETEA